ncbi:MAG: insulinase family protein [Reichenbachiella sp.]
MNQFHLTKYLLLFVASILISCESEPQKYQTLTAEEGGYTYEYVVGDPMNTRIYTLENGLKVYLSDYDDAPRVQVYLPVKAGGKNDPATNTGLAHYLEHMMFKGNDKFGTLDYEKEVIMLDSIEAMFNYYASLTDASERKAYYEKIDAYSNKAAELAIPNEYDKMISLIGGKGLNAYTTNDRTVYTVDIPSNELPRFLEMEGSRFKKIVNRLFHTELEAVYEEKNRGLDSDGRKLYYSVLRNMFKEHQYGTQTVIGTIDHLKNPSITEIKKYFNKYYRPNNVAICMSGDLEFTKTIQLIESNFGDWEPNPELSKWNKTEEQPITEPRVGEVFGPDAEWLYMAYRFDGTGSDNNIKAQLVDMILNNSVAGLIDLNLKQEQTVLDAGSFVHGMNDYSMHFLYGNAKQGQTLEEVKDLILEQIELVKKGEFEDWLIPAVIADFKINAMKGLESNRSRANEMVMAFTNDLTWSDYIQKIDKMESFSKEEIIAFANEHYQDNYTVAYKRVGEDPNKQKVEKPSITKVPVNRDVKSDFHTQLADQKVDKLSPLFLDFEKDINKVSVNKVEVLTKVNSENELFELTYLLDAGKNADPKLAISVQYLEFIGTAEYSAADFKKELYKIGCSFNVFSTDERTYVTLSGLNENMEQATKLFESLLTNPSPDQDALDKMIDRTLKSRADAKKNKSNILWRGLSNYAKYGADNPFTNVLDNYELQQLKAEELTAMIQSISKLPHRILYYGPQNADQITQFLTANHQVPAVFDEMPDLKVFEELPLDQQQVFWANYDMVQSEIVFHAKGNKYDPDMEASSQLYNEYFGGGMNSILFQEIREAQGLAYSVYSRYRLGKTTDKSNYQFAYIGTQADKQSEAMDAVMELLKNMPESQDAFELAKSAILNKIESERITKSDVIWKYIEAQDKGVDYDNRKDIYSQVAQMKFEDLIAFHDKYVENNNYVTVLVGSEDNIDFEALKEYGEIKELSLDELFGYKDPEFIELE